MMNSDTWPSYIACVSTDGVLVSVTKSFVELLGLRIEEVVGHSIMEYIQPVEKGSIEEIILEMNQLGSKNVQELDCVIKDKGTSLKLKMEKLCGEGDLVLIRLISEIKILSNASPPSSYDLAQELMKWEGLLIVAINNEGTVIAISESVEFLLGMRREDVIGRKFSELIQLDSMGNKLISSALAKVESGEPWSGEIILSSQVKGPIRMNWRLQPMLDDQGHVISTIGFGHIAHHSLSLKENETVIVQGLEILSETISEIVEAHDVFQSLENHLEKLVDAVGADFSVMRLIGRENKPRMICSGIDFRRARNLLESHLVGQGPLYRGVQSGLVFISTGVQSDPRIILEDKDVKSLVCLPIRYKEEVYGCGAFGFTDKTANIQSILPFLQMLCTQLALSMHRIKLMDDLILKDMELSTLYETSNIVSSGWETKQVLYAIMTKTAELARADAVYLFQLDKNTATLHLISSISPYSNVVEGLTIRVGEGITGIVAQTREGMLVERADRDTRSLHVPGTPDDPSSLISVPLKMGNDLLGVMTLERVPGLPFNEEDFRLVHLFSFQAATALYNAQMFNRLNEHAISRQMLQILLTHDVANYNVPIHGYLEMLAKDPKLDERQRRFVKSCLAQSENISSLIADVRKLSLLRTMESVRSFEPIELPKVIMEVLDSIRQNILYEDVDVHFHPISKQAIVLGDSFVKDLVHNLILNACKHAGDWPIDIVLQEHEEGGLNYWRMDVKDQGGGISEERKAFLFQRFENLDAGSASEGHGIGLSVVKALCERYGGRIWVENREKLDGVKGSTFSVILPMVKV
ncbi:MAG: GAF domain-containing protein [Methanomassiliicoccales archaeon]